MPGKAETISERIGAAVDSEPFADSALFSVGVGSDQVDYVVNIVVTSLAIDVGFLVDPIGAHLDVGACEG